MFHRVFLLKILMVYSYFIPLFILKGSVLFFFSKILLNKQTNNTICILSKLSGCLVSNYCTKGNNRPRFIFASLSASEFKTDRFQNNFQITVIMRKSNYFILYDLKAWSLPYDFNLKEIWIRHSMSEFEGK